MVCSAGRPGLDTPPGTFTISNRAAWMYMADGSYGQYATRFNGAILFHSVCYKRKDPSTLMTHEYNDLGGLASMGCVRLQTADAKWIFDNCPPGTRVTIYDAEDPGPLGKPETLLPQIAPEQDRGWDPTDPREDNPWREVIGDRTGTSSAILGMPFRDVTLRDWAYPQVLGAYRADLMRGTSPESFSPEGLITYAQALQLVYNLREDRTAETVPGGSPWYAPALQWAQRTQILLPEDPGFDVDSPISRQMFALYLSRLAQAATQADGMMPEEKKGDPLSLFADADKISPLCRGAMTWAAEQGILAGYNGQIQPHSSLTRAQAATMLLRFRDIGDGSLFQNQ
jgi:hypothetical protein